MPACYIKQRTWITALMFLINIK